MKIKSILVSQPKPLNETSPYLDLIKKQKVKIDFRPFIQIKGVDCKDVRQQKIDLSKFGCIIFTSRNAVDNYFRIAEDMRFKVPDTMKYFCISEAIAYYLQKYVVFRKRKIYAGKKDIKELVDVLKKNKNEHFLLPSSDVLSTNISSFLDGLNLNWVRGIFYRTVSSDLSDINGIKYDIIVFYSPYGVKSLFENFPSFNQDETKIAVFGQTAREAAQKAGLRVDIQVPTPETPSMTMALEKYIEQANKRS